MVCIISLSQAMTDRARKKVLFDNLTPLYPDEPLNLSHAPDEFTSRVIDLMVPVGKGQRALIVALCAVAHVVLAQNGCFLQLGGARVELGLDASRQSLAARVRAACRGN